MDLNLKKEEGIQSRMLKERLAWAEKNLYEVGKKRFGWEEWLIPLLLTAPNPVLGIESRGSCKARLSALPLSSTPTNPLAWYSLGPSSLETVVMEHEGIILHFYFFVPPLPRPLLPSLLGRVDTESLKGELERKLSTLLIFNFSTGD